MSLNYLLCKSWRHLKELGISLLLVAITVGIIVGSGLCTHAPEKAVISPDVTYSDLQFIVTNNDPFDWTNVQLELNNTFQYEIVTIHAGQALHVKIQDFAMADGTKFDPLTEAPSQLVVTCDTPKGKVQWVESISSIAG